MKKATYRVESNCILFHSYCDNIDGVQFKMVSGNVDAGTIKMYGVS